MCVNYKPMIPSESKYVSKITEAIVQVINLNGGIHIGTFHIRNRLQKEYKELNVDEYLSKIEDNLLNLGYVGFIGKHQLKFTELKQV